MRQVGKTSTADHGLDTSRSPLPSLGCGLHVALRHNTAEPKPLSIGLFSRLGREGKVSLSVERHTFSTDHGEITPGLVVDRTSYSRGVHCSLSTH